MIMRNDAALWTLIRENKDDDVALGAAQIVSGLADTPTQQLAAGEVFINHRLFEEALPLFVLRDVQEELADDDALARQVTLVGVDVLVAFAPDAPGHELRGQLLPGEDVLVHADNPGVWAFHCHILNHVEGPEGMFGMVTALIVQ